MTYKKRHKYRKSIKRKKIGGAAALPAIPKLPTLPTGAGVPAVPALPAGVPAIPKDAAGALGGMSGGKGGAAAKGMADAKDKGMAAAKGAADKAMAMFKGAAAKAGVPTGIPGKGGAAELEEALITAILKSVKGKKSSSPYIMLAQFILNVRTQAKLNYSLASKLIKSPRLRENKYKKQIIALKPDHMENFKCGCKLIYLYYYDEYATKYSFMIDNQQEIDDMCKLFYVINQQILIYSSTKTKLLSHFNEIFENDNFSNLYNENVVKPETNCTVMRSKIHDLFKRDTNDYSYIILDLLFDLLNETSIYFINIMDDLKNNNQTKICDISEEMSHILSNCSERKTYALAMKLLYPM